MSLFEKTQERLQSIFESKRAGVALVLKAANVNRLDILTWIIDEFAGFIDPRHEFTALTVCDQNDALQHLQRRVRAARIERTGVEPDDLMVSDENKVVKRLADFTYIGEHVMRDLQESFEPDILSLLILDERRTGLMTGYASFVARVEPSLTIFVTKQDLAPHSPWRQFGDPLIVGPTEGPAVRRTRRARH